MPYPVQTHWKYSGPQITVEFSKVLTKICFLSVDWCPRGNGNIFNNISTPEIVEEVAAEFWINKFAHFSETTTTQQQQQ